MNELGAAKVPAKLASYVDDLGAMFAGTKQFKIFTLDGGGGTSIFGQGHRPTSGAPGRSRPNDPMPGLLMYTEGDVSRTRRRSALTGWDIGEPNTTNGRQRRRREDQGGRLRVQRPPRAVPAEHAPTTRPR